MSKSSYQVIARRWRPKQFSELVGQDHVVRTLGNAIEQGRIAHAYLFVGPRGTGKTTSARLFAKSLNWEDGPSLEVPEGSEIGQAIMEGRCLDVIEIDGASNNSVEQVRDLRDECQYAPSQCRFKIYVIDEVHMLSQQAFNALLKTLEEPPPHVKFVFATTESNKVLPTIVSRCQRFEFRSIPSPLIVGKLQEICQAEGIEADQEALEAISRMAMGGMRDAQSILDQMISFCGKALKPEDVLDVYGLAAADQIKDLGDAILDADYEKILASTNQFAEMGLDFYRALLDLSEYFREKLLSSLSGEGDSGEIYPEQITRVLDTLQNGESLVKLGLSEKANFEVTLFRAVESARSKSIDQVIRRITQTIPEGAKKKSPKPEVKLAPQSAPEKVAESSPEIPGEKIQKDESRESLTPPEPKPSDSGGKEKEMSVDLDVAENSEKQEQVEAQTSQAVHTSEKREDAPVNDLRITDPDVIEQRVQALPAAIRKIVEEDFKGEYVAVEKIDPDKLI
jgi:DNA polymerase-3 subunit gamma/tau